MLPTVEAGDPASVREENYCPRTLPTAGAATDDWHPGHVLHFQVFDLCMYPSTVVPQPVHWGRASCCVPSCRVLPTAEAADPASVSEENYCPRTLPTAGASTVDWHQGHVLRFQVFDLCMYASTVVPQPVQ